MPPDVTIDQIVEYWSTHKDECGLGIDWAEAHERCWRCGYKTKLHKCHIKPDSLEGEYVPKNLVLLCGRCHREAPNVDDPRFIWIWLTTTSVPFYDTYWTIRGSDEFEIMFGRKPFREIEIGKFTEEEIKKCLKKRSLKLLSILGKDV